MAATVLVVMAIFTALALALALHWLRAAKKDKKNKNAAWVSVLED